MLKCRYSQKFLRARARVRGHERWVLGDRRTEAGQGENGGRLTRERRLIEGSTVENTLLVRSKLAGGIGELI